MKATLIVAVTAEHFAKCTSFMDVDNCPLALALKEMYPRRKIIVGATTLVIKTSKTRAEYRIENWLKATNRTEEIAATAQCDLYKALAIDGKVKEVPTFMVNLIPIEEN